MPEGENKERLMMKAASSIPPAVKPTGHKTSVGAAELLRRLEPAPGGLSTEIEEATRNLQKALKREHAFLVKEMERLQQRIPPNPPPPIAPPPQAGDNDGMERRLTDLENDMKDVRERLVRVETKIDAAQQKLDSLPSKDFVTAAVSGSTTKMIIWVAALVGAAQIIPSIAVPLLRHFGIAQ